MILVLKIRYISASRCVLDRFDGKCERVCVGIPVQAESENSGNSGGSSSRGTPCDGELPPGGNFCFIAT